MYTAVTQGIRVSVDTRYEGAESLASHENIFAYHVWIENTSENRVRLLRRHWVIFDSNCEVRQVEGSGVVGQTPVIEPGNSFEYSSACNLKSPVGNMQGQYMMENLTDKEFFYVEIPKFRLEAPWKLN